MKAISKEKVHRRTLVVDPTGGLSGDMFLAALFALGVSPKAVSNEVARLPKLEPFRIVCGRVRRRGMSVWRAKVVCNSETKERDLGSILRMIDRSPLDGDVKELASRTFMLLGEAEGKVHGVPVERVHFHEIGAVDSIVDIVGAVVALSLLGFPRLFHRPFRLGSGTVVTSHGELPVPAPATIELLRGRTVRLSHETGEIVTPTGAALMKALAEELSFNLSFSPKRIVYSVGTREPTAEAGLLRIIDVEGLPFEREIVVIRTTIDDMNPESYEYVQERLFAEGALEVYLTQLIMKKGRPGILVTVLCESKDREKITNLLFRETTTLGVRMSYEGRKELERWTENVKTPLGTVHVKRCVLPDGTVKISPEYESCKGIARTKGIPIGAVYTVAKASAETGEERGVKGKRRLRQRRKRLTRKKR